MEKIQRNFGVSLKKWRLKKELKLKDMALHTGLSVSFLSKIENGVSNPSVDNIQKICSVLGITPDDLLAPDNKTNIPNDGRKDTPYILRHTERGLLHDFSGSIRLESVFERKPHFQVSAITLAGNSKSRYSTLHTYDKLMIIASGSASVKLNNTTEYILNPGDALMIRANQPHTITCISGKSCTGYWIEIFNK